MTKKAQSGGGRPFLPSSVLMVSSSEHGGASADSEVTQARGPLQSDHLQRLGEVRRGWREACKRCSRVACGPTRSTRALKRKPRGRPRRTNKNRSLEYSTPLISFFPPPGGVSAYFLLFSLKYTHRRLPTEEERVGWEPCYIGFRLLQTILQHVQPHFYTCELQRVENMSPRK